MNNNVILSQVPLDELCDAIAEKVLERIQSLEKTESSSSLLKIEEVADLLQVTRQTISEWKRKGILPFHRMGGRVYFKKEEVIQAMKKIHS